MATYVLTGLITFPKYEEREAFQIRRFSECEIKSSWNNLTDTADIIIPHKLKDFNRRKATDWFRIGDPVQIDLGYGGDKNHYTEFTGYITSIDFGMPIKLSCQDEMFQLRQKTLTVSETNIILKDLLQIIAPDYNIVCDDTILIGDVAFSNMTPANCLEKLKEQGITCFFRNKTLYAMDDVERLDGDTYKIRIEDTPTGTQNLETKPTVNIKATIEVIRRKGKKLRFEYGDKNAGIFFNRSFSGIEMSESEIKELAIRLYERAKKPGLKGDLTLFGVPRVTVGDKIKLVSELFRNDPVYKGKTYEIDAITKRFSKDGYRQICTLGDVVE